MKRKLALLLAGCLAISPAAAGYYPTQAFAAETGTESGSEGQVTLLVSVSDENGTALTEVSEEGAKNADAGQYSMAVGETRQLIASMEQEDAFPALSIWSSETPEIIDIDDDGFITAKSSGTGLVVLSISYDASQNPAEYKYEITVSEAEAEVSEEIAEAADTAAASAEEIIPEEPAAPAEVPAEAGSDAAAEAAVDTTVTDTAAAGQTEAAESGDPAVAAAVETADSAATAVENADSAATTAGQAEAAESGAPAVAAADEAAADPEDTSTASIAMNSAVETGNASSKVEADQGKAAVVTPHWEGENGAARSYITSDGTKAAGKVEIDGETYIFTPEGVMQTGWAKY